LRVLALELRTDKKNHPSELKYYLYRMHAGRQIVASHYSPQLRLYAKSLLFPKG